jgi:hypothetical protein
VYLVCQRDFLRSTNIDKGSYMTMRLEGHRHFVVDILFNVAELNLKGSHMVNWICSIPTVAVLCRYTLNAVG